MQYSRLYADVSSNNPNVNMIEYASAGHVLIAIKATEGLHYINPDHRTWSLHAGLHHVGVVHYHFARPDVPDGPIAQADHFLSVAGPLTGGRDYLALDLERATPAGWTHDPQWSRDFCNHIRSVSRFDPWLYATRSTLQGFDGFLSGPVKPVWDADWSNTADFVPAGYTLAARQFTDGLFGPEPHSLPGIGTCDVNRMSDRVYRRALEER